MIATKKRNQGITLLEIILVLAIGAMIILLGMRQYQAFRREADIQQLRANVDMLFASAARLFKGFCADTTGTFAFGKYQPQSLTVSITSLDSKGYLDKDALTYSPYVNYGPPAPEGYIIQFNQVHQSGALPDRTHALSPAGSGTAPTGKIVIWRIQISVNLKSGYSGLKSPLGADCLSTSSGGIVTPCASAPSGATQFAVFERLPSLASSKENSILSWTMPTVKQFKQMYTTDPILILIDPSQTTQLNSQYYVCGS